MPTGGDRQRSRSWAVVQDLRPFGLRVEKRYRSKRHADQVASRSRYLFVQPAAYVDAENARLMDPAEFDAELALYTRSRR